MDVIDDRIKYGQNLVMWSEAVLIPSVFVTDQDIRWEDENSPWTYITIEGVEYNVELQKSKE